MSAQGVDERMINVHYYYGILTDTLKKEGKQTSQKSASTNKSQGLTGLGWILTQKLRKGSKEHYLLGQNTTCKYLG